MSNIYVRKSNRDDMKQVAAMIVELATFEGYPDGAKLTTEDLERDGFEASPPKFVCYVAEASGSTELVGYLLGNFAYSSWHGNALYMEDFYVKPSYRGCKVGHLLFKEFCKLARDTGCCRIDWHVLVENKIACDFYKGHGAFDVCESENRTCHRVLADRILAVANSE